MSRSFTAAEIAAANDTDLYGLPISNAVTLCGLHDGPLETYLNENPHIKQINLCLDADRRGSEASERLTGKYKALGYEMEPSLPPSGKDWNDYLSIHHRLCIPKYPRHRNAIACKAD